MAERVISYGVPAGTDQSIIFQEVSDLVSQPQYRGDQEKVVVNVGTNPDLRKGSSERTVKIIDPLDPQNSDSYITQEFIATVKN